MKNPVTCALRKHIFNKGEVLATPVSTFAPVAVFTPLVFVGFAVVHAITTPARADLIAAWQTAQTKDPAYLASLLETRVGQARQQQAESLWKPNVFLSAGAGFMGAQTATRGAQFSTPGFGSSEDVKFNTSIYAGVMGRVAITAVKPLIDASRQAEMRQLGLSAQASELMKASGRQQLMLHVVERYLDVLSAQESIRLLDQHEQVLVKADAELRRRLKLRDASVTDTQESAQRLQALRAQRTALVTDLQIRLAALEDLAGAKPKLGALNANAKPGNLSALPVLLERMRSAHPKLKMLDLQAQAAQEEIAKFGKGSQSMRVEAIGQASFEHLAGTGQYGSASNTGSQQMLGLQLTVPISTGGFRSARQEEAIAMVEKIRLEKDQTSLEMERQLRAIWHALNASADRLKALQLAQQASNDRLTATRQAHPRGARTTLELLGAESDAVAAEAAVFHERMAYVANLARAAYAAGDISEDTLQAVNQFIQ
jgi:outer membrane protein